MFVLYRNLTCEPFAIAKRHGVTDLVIFVGYKKAVDQIIFENQ